MMPQALRSRPIRRLMVLGAVPILLLVPLGIMKWRADHPPLSSMDRLFRAAFGTNTSVFIAGEDERWRQLAGCGNYGFCPSIVVTNPATLHEIVETLRCTGQVQSVGRGAFHSKSISMDISARDPQTHRRIYTSFIYWSNAKASYLGVYDYKSSLLQNNTIVQPRFAARFEALVARIAAASKVARAKVKSHHPSH